MRNLLQISIFIFVLSAISPAQGVPVARDKAPALAAPPGWTLYKVSAADVAVLLPKLPVRTEWGDSCGEVRGSIYYAYADEAVYELRFFTKDAPIPKECRVKNLFGQETLDRRLADLRGSQPAPVSETDGELGGRKAKIFRWETTDEIAIRWVIPDLGSDRWHELALNQRADVKTQEKAFLDSLVFSAANGTEILMGSLGMPGDKAGDIRRAMPATGGLAELPISYKSKPRPQFTEMARKNREQGTVVLKVEFLPNGSIGSITVASGLAHGLTEEAIAAAKRIVFMPARAHGVPVTMVRNVEYRFSF